MGCCAKTSLPLRGPGKPRTGNRAVWKLREKESEDLDQSGKEREGGGHGRWATGACAGSPFFGPCHTAPSDGRFTVCSALEVCRAVKFSTWLSAIPAHRG